MSERIGEKRSALLLAMGDPCPLCTKLMKDHSYGWRIFHGEANAHPCGAVVQIKSWYNESPDPEIKEILAKIDAGMIYFKIDDEWIEPLKQALALHPGHSIDSQEVQEEAQRIKDSNDKGERG